MKRLTSALGAAIFLIATTVARAEPEPQTESVEDLRMAISVLQQQRNSALDAVAMAQVQIAKLRQQLDAKKKAEPPKE